MLVGQGSCTCKDDSCAATSSLKCCNFIPRVFWLWRVTKTLMKLAAIRILIGPHSTSRSALPEYLIFLKRAHDQLVFTFECILNFNVFHYFFAYSHKHVLIILLHIHKMYLLPLYILWLLIDCLLNLIDCYCKVTCKVFTKHFKHTCVSQDMHGE